MDNGYDRWEQGVSASVVHSSSSSSLQSLSIFKKLKLSPHPAPLSKVSSWDTLSRSHTRTHTSFCLIADVTWNNPYGAPESEKEDLFKDDPPAK